MPSLEVQANHTMLLLRQIDKMFRVLCACKYDKKAVYFQCELHKTRMFKLAWCVNTLCTTPK